MNYNRLLLPISGFLLASIYILVYGYTFQGNDQAEHLPQVYKLINPELYHGDFFMEECRNAFSVRFYWVWMVFLFSMLIPVSWVCFSLHFFCIISVFVAWMKITRIFISDFYSQLLSVIFGFFIFKSFSVGGNELLGNIFYSSTVAEAISFWSVYYFLTSRYKLAGLLGGLAGLFQMVFAMQVFAIGFFVLLIHKTERKWSHLLSYGVTFLLSTSPMLVPMLMQQKPAGNLSMQEYYMTLFYQRAYMHFIPSVFPLVAYTKVLFLLFIIIGLYPMVTGINLKMVMIYKMIGAIVLGCMGYYLLIEPLGLLTIGNIQWFKSTVWLGPLAALILVCALQKYIPKREVKSKQWFYLSVFVGIAIVVLINLSAYLPSLIAGRYKTGIYPKSDLEKMHEWIKQNTSIDALCVVPPIDNSFACEAMRPTPVNFKALLFNPVFFEHWRQTMTDYYGIDFEKLGKNEVLPVAQYNYNHAFYYPTNNKVKYRLDNIKSSSILPQLGETLHTEGDWIFTKVTHDQNK